MKGKRWKIKNRSESYEHKHRPIFLFCFVCFSFCFGLFVCFLFCVVLFCFLFCFVLFFKPLKIVQVYQNGQFFTEKNHSILRLEKIRKTDFAPSEKYSSYATGLTWAQTCCPDSNILVTCCRWRVFCGAGRSSVRTPGKPPY